MASSPQGTLSSSLRHSSPKFTHGQAELSVLRAQCGLGASRDKGRQGCHDERLIILKSFARSARLLLVFDAEATMRPMTDVVVLLPGITGSVLRDSRGRDLWAPTAGAAARALVTLGRSITDLELRGEDADDGVTAPMMVPDLHLIPGLWKVDGYSKISGYLQQQFAVTPGKNFFAFPYDWRRDNRVAARRLK
jgi:hypothetical protein